MLARILAERARGERAIVPVADDVPAQRRATRLVGLAAAAALIVGVGATLTVRASNRLTSEGALAAASGTSADSLPTLRGMLTLSMLPAAAQAQGMAALAGGAPPMVDGRRVRVGRYTYRLTYTANGRPTEAPEMGEFTIAPGRYDGAPAWRVTNGWQGHARDMVETTYVDMEGLRPRYRIAHDVGYSKYRVEQWFARDSVTGTMQAPSRKVVTIARHLPPSSGPYLVGEAGPVLWLQGVQLAPHWNARVATVGWGAVASDIYYPIGLRVMGEERVRVPAGTFDCWALLVFAAGRQQTTYVRKSDGVAVLTRDTTEVRGRLKEIALVEEQPLP
jgi:hypothetical protein